MLNLKQWIFLLFLSKFLLKSFFLNLQQKTFILDDYYIH